MTSRLAAQSPYQVAPFPPEAIGAGQCMWGHGS